MSVRLVVLGSGTCVPRRRRGPAGYAVEAGRYRILIDSGSGTLGRLAAAGHDYRELSHALYTHTHVDHTADLGPLLFALEYTPGFRREAPLALLGPRGFPEFVDRLAQAWPWILPESRWLEIDEIHEETRAWDALAVSARAVAHGELPANAYRLEIEGRSIVFSGDTRSCPAIVEIARDADLLVIEASLPEGPAGTDVHLTAAQAGQIAARASAKRVVLTHLYPACDEVDMVARCRSEYDGEVTIAEDLMSIELGARPE